MNVQVNQRVAALPAPRPVTEVMPQESMLHKIGYGVVLVYLVLIFSRVLDVSFYYLRIPLILFTIMVATTLLSGGFARLLQFRTSFLMLVLMLWIWFTLLFSTWKGGSVESVIDTARSFCLGAALVGLLSSVRQVTRAMYAIAIGVLGGAIIGLASGQQQLGRLVFEVGAFGDPNLFGMTLLVGLPFWWLMVKNTKSKLIRISAAVAVAIVLVAFLRTGSRGALLGFGFVLAYMFVVAPLKQKVALAGLVIVGGLGSIFVLPAYLRVRYMTVFEADAAEVAQLNREEQEYIENSDVGSAHGRWRLLMESIDMTLKHPITGVGPGMFSYANWEDKKIPGVGRAASVTHNAYTQLSSETGIPGMLLFVAMLVSSFRSLTKIFNMHRKHLLSRELLYAAYYLKLALIMVSACAFFLSVAYGPLFFVIAGLTAALQRAAGVDVAVAERQALVRPATLSQLRPAPAVTR